MLWSPGSQLLWSPGSQLLPVPLPQKYRALIHVCVAMVVCQLLHVSKVIFSLMAKGLVETYFLGATKGLKNIVPNPQ